MDPIDILVSDAVDLLLGAMNAPTWGIYLDGNPVVQPASIGGQGFFPSVAPIQALASIIGAPNIVPTTASTVDFSYAKDYPISTFPQEQGAFQAYNKVTLPFDVKLRLASNGGGAGASGRQAFISTCLAISSSLSLFDIVTPEMTFPSSNCTHIDFDRKAAKNATLIVIDLFFKEIPVTASANFANTQQPGDSGQQSLGNAQPQQPSQQTTQTVSVGSIV